MPPLAVRILAGFDARHDLRLDRWKGQEIADTYWDAEAVDASRLPDEFHVAWIDGPTYYEDGSTETPSSWAVKLHDIL